MIEPGGSGAPRYQWGMRVRAVQDLYNDGSYPDWPADALLVKEGDTGEIVNIGTIAETNQPLYLVEFHGRTVVGCMEEEIFPL